jgi:hypothetical protein
MFSLSQLASIYLPFAIRHCRQVKAIALPDPIGPAVAWLLASVAVAVDLQFFLEIYQKISDKLCLCPDCKLFTFCCRPLIKISLVSSPQGAFALCPLVFARFSDL